MILDGGRGIDFAAFVLPFRRMRIISKTGAARAIAAFNLLAAASLAAGCASDQQVASPVDPGPTQPATAAYDCGEDGTLTVQTSGTGVRIVDAEGAELFLPAAPPNQSNRFGEGANAIVIEGREALYMHGNRPPITCTR